MGEICLLGHSLGGDLARYLASEFPSDSGFDSPGWGYLDMEKILPLEEELEGTGVFHEAASFCDLEEAVLSELGDGADPTPIARKAVEASYRWNPASEQYELNLDLEKVMALLRLRRQIRLTRFHWQTCLSSLSGLDTKKNLNGERCSEATRSPDQASLARRFGARTVYRGA